MDKAKVRERLEARRHDLEKLCKTPEPSDELSHYDQHPADAATETYEREQAFSIVEMAEAGLRDIDLAAHRLDEGKYGICELCTKPIDEERLKARPEARYCVEHAPS